MASTSTEPGRARRGGRTTAREQATGRHRSWLSGGSARVGRTGSRAGGAWLTLTSGLGAALPVVAATVEGLREGATPTGDRAIIVTRAYDVFSSHTPLVGQFSASSVLYDHVVHSLGPLLYWLLAVPVRIGASAPPALAMALLNALAILAAVALARRVGGVAWMIAAAVAIALMCGSLTPETLHDVWNPSAGLLPLTLLIFVCWSMACGEHRLLPVAVALASFTAQCELVFLAPSLGALGLGVLGLLVRRRSRGAAWRWWLAALGVGLVCWSAPIADELTGHPGNLTLVARAAFSHGHTLGATAGWRAVVRAVGIPPWWLTAPHDPFGRLADVRAAPAQLAVVSCIVLLVGLVAVLALAVWRRRGAVAWAAALALVLCLSLAGVTASTPSRPSLESSLGYMLWVGSPIGMWAWLTLAWSTISPLGDRLGRGRATGAGVRRTAAALGAAGALAAGATVAAGQGADQDQPEYAPVKRVQALVRGALGSRRTVLVTGSHSFTAFDFRAAVIYDLRRRGVRVYAPAASVRLGSYYEPSPHGHYTTVWVFDERRPPPHGRVIARLRYGAKPVKTITVMISGPFGR